MISKSKEFCEKEFTTYTIARPKGHVPAVPLIQREEKMSRRRWCLRGTSTDVVLEEIWMSVFKFGVCGLGFVFFFW